MRYLILVILQGHPRSSKERTTAFICYPFLRLSSKDISEETIIMGISVVEEEYKKTITSSFKWFLPARREFRAFERISRSVLISFVTETLRHVRGIWYRSIGNKSEVCVYEEIGKRNEEVNPCKRKDTNHRPRESYREISFHDRARE